MFIELSGKLNCLVKYEYKSLLMIKLSSSDLHILLDKFKQLSRTFKVNDFN